MLFREKIPTIQQLAQVCMQLTWLMVSGSCSMQRFILPPLNECAPVSKMTDLVATVRGHPAMVQSPVRSNGTNQMLTTSIQLYV